MLAHKKFLAAQMGKNGVWEGDGLKSAVLLPTAFAPGDRGLRRKGSDTGTKMDCSALVGALVRSQLVIGHVYGERSSFGRRIEGQK